MGATEELLQHVVRNGTRGGRLRSVISHLSHMGMCERSIRACKRKFVSLLIAQRTRGMETGREAGKARRDGCTTVVQRLWCAATCDIAIFCCIPFLLRNCRVCPLHLRHSFPRCAAHLQALSDRSPFDEPPQSFDSP